MISVFNKFKGKDAMKQRADGRWVKVKRFNGKAISFYSTAKTEKAALKDIEDQMVRYIQKASRQRSFGEIAQDWREEHQAKVTYKTWQGYQAHFTRALEEFGDIPIDEIRTADVQRYVNRLGKQGFAYKTVKSGADVVSMICDYGIMMKQLSSNPCDYVKLPANLPREERELPSEEQIEKVKNGIECHFGEFAYLLLYTGLRRGEALALRAEHVDFEKRLIHVRQSVYFKSNRPELKQPKTKAGIRDVYLLDCLVPILEGKRGYIFGGDAPMSEQAFRRAWERYRKESGVTVTPHQLRHAHATMLYENEISAKSAQKLLGHSDVKTTLAIYTHISEQRKSEDFEKLNALSKLSQKS